LASVNRGLKRGLKGRERTVLLMLDETIITETPPLYTGYGHIGSLSPRERRRQAGGLSGDFWLTKQ
jgi:hypothetical protein